MQYKRCSRCLMSNSSDSTMTFDSEGHCTYCNGAIKWLRSSYFPNEHGEKKFKKAIAEAKKAGKGNKYDCIIGISGGLDSSYLAYKLSNTGLRVLAVHIDDGYDTEISKQNIARLINKTGYDYKVITPDASQFNALTLAYMKAGVPNIAVPQDNVLFAFLYDCIRKYHIKYFFSGSNLALESIYQKGNTWKNTDVVNIKAIHKKYGTKPIDNLKFLSTMRRTIDKRIYGIKTVTPLDFMDYNRDRAFAELKEYCGFEYYGRKHLENSLTAFVQLRWFPEKFNVDKRTWHLSSMIISGQMTREQAMKELEEPMFDKTIMRDYQNQIIRNLGITNDELEKMINSPGHQHFEYKTEDDTLIFKIFKTMQSIKKKQKIKRFGNCLG